MSGVWKKVCRADEVPANGMKTFAVNGTSVLIVHTGETFVAVQPFCPHEAIPLDQGIHDGRILTCLEHMWQFDLQTFGPIGEAESGLQSYPLREEAGELFVEL